MMHRGFISKYLVEQLMKADVKMVRDAIDTLVVDNNVFYGDLNSGFSYMGYYYQHGMAVVQDLGYGPTLHKSLVPRVAGLAERWMQLEADNELLTKLFDDLMKPCRENQDIRDTLPECAIQFDLTLQSLPRTRDEAFTARDDTQLRFRYNMARERILTYAAMHLLVP